MIGPRVVPLASLIWSFGVVALVVPRMTALREPVTAEPNQPSQPLDIALAILRNAERFSSAGVGVAGITPNEVMAWRVISFRADAESTFLKLLDTGTPAGQLYALAGLRFRNDSVFARKASRFKARADQVQTIRGCIGGAATFGELVAEITKGDWVRDYLRGSDYPLRP